ncbi:MAG: sigma-70 family RNA polymerase sigma factor [Alphaproteobacteria bacterium]|nr:sigma-70 family RNA polymerase sigma factor [Alphaproteobacteria bacterium]
MTELSGFSADLMQEVPRLRAFGVSLSGSLSAADDLVQETLIKAWTHRTSFVPGTNLRAWLFTILRNTFRSQRRKLGRELGDDGHFAERLTTPAGQHGRLEMLEMRAALDKLPADQREALVLIGISGCSYEEAAVICGVAEGTVKSRVNRARRRLRVLLDVGDAGEIGPQGSDLAILSASLTDKPGG